MCGRYGFRETAGTLRRALRLTEALAVPEPRYNIAPTQPAPVVGEDGRGRRLGELRWGIALARPGGSPRTVFNLRAETVLREGLWRQRLLGARLVVPASHFYEWVGAAGARRRVPILVRRRDGAPLCLGAIFARSDHEPEGRAFAIITTQAPPELRHLHTRWPVVLGAEDVDAWLDAKTAVETVAQLLLPPPAGWFEHYAVGDGVNSVANDSPDLMLPRAEDHHQGELSLLA